MTNPEPLIISPSTSLVRLTSELDGAQQLLLRHLGTSLAPYGHGLKIRPNSNAPLPITVEIADFDDGTSRWTMNASHHSGTCHWTRAGDCCKFSWGSTSGEVEVLVVATNGAQTKTKPIFITVEPEGGKPGR